MFDFQKLKVYQQALEFYDSMIALIKTENFDEVVIDQLRRASLSISLNIAEGNSRFSPKAKKNFLVIARGSAFEFVAIMECLLKTKQISTETFNLHYATLEEISKMTIGIIKRLE